MKPRGLLLPAFALLTALACNLPFASTPGELAPSALPPETPTSSPAIAPTQPVAASLPPPAESPSPLLSATQQAQPATPPPAAPPMALFNPYAVILVEENDVLNARLMPGANHAIIGTLPSDATGVQLTGKEAFVGDNRWVGALLPDGKAGWVNAYFLTEQVPASVFCTDPQVYQLIDNLRQALIESDGRLFSSLVSPIHGLDVNYLHSGNTANYSSEEARWVFQSDYAMDWGVHPASGLKVSGSFQETVLPDLLNVLAAPYQTRCNNPELGGGNYTYVWPARYRNINYLVLHKPGPPGNELAWRTWIAGIEYVEGRPYLFALVHLFWEP